MDERFEHFNDLFLEEELTQTLLIEYQHDAYEIAKHVCRMLLSWNMLHVFFYIMCESKKYLHIIYVLHIDTLLYCQSTDRYMSSITDNLPGRF